MTHKTRTTIQAVALGALCVGALAVGVWRLRATLATGEEGLTVWFYDQSEQRLYAAGRDTIAPDKGVGGVDGDGVRAVVVACECEQGDKSKWQIAYLETYTPELKALLEDVQQARAEGRPYGEPIPSRDSDFVQANTLVRRPGESSWHSMTTPEARHIVTEWKARPCPNGLSPVICTP